jgi:hypothetical protein
MTFPLFAGDAGREPVFAKWHPPTWNWSTTASWMAGCS